LNKDRLIKLELNSIKDLVKIACGLRIPLVYRYRRGEETSLMVIYSAGGNVIVAYVKKKEDLKGDYIIYDTLTGNYSFSEKISADPKNFNMAVVDLRYCDII